MSEDNKKAMLPYKTARDFLASLRWPDDGPSVFVPFELRSYALKWLKYSLLEKVGLTSINYLDSAICRLNSGDLNTVLDTCKSMLSSDYMVVIKIVYFNKASQLPNFRIYSTNELDEVVKELGKRSLSPFDQIWLCKTDTNTSNTNFGGRITFCEDYSLSVLEMIWFTSPRIIEEYKNNNKFQYPFLRGSKFPGKLSFRIDHLYLPSYYRRDECEQRFKKDFFEILIHLHSLSEKISLLEKILYQAGAKEVCLEFKASNGIFSIIDWDTEIETVMFK